MVPPVALLAYDRATPRISAFWPYAVFSPEWQALQWAVANQAAVRFCDLPAGAFLTTPKAPKGANDEPAAEPDEDEDDRPDPFRHVRDDPSGMPATAAGYDDPERGWDDVTESRLDGQSPFDALTEAMSELRQHTAPPPPGERLREERREAYMRQTLRAALKQTDGSVAVV